MTALPITIETDLPGEMISALRTNHAGETGAVWIYKGILSVSRDPSVVAFARDHLETEQRHLAWIEHVLDPDDRSVLLPLWRTAGWITGALPALFGPRAVFLTIAAVETFVDQHYQDQIDWLKAHGSAPALRALLRRCQLDEQHHLEDARDRGRGAKPGFTAKIWVSLVARGSAAAVALARRI